MNEDWEGPIAQEHLEELDNAENAGKNWERNGTGDRVSCATSFLAAWAVVGHLYATDIRSPDRECATCANNGAF